jgi:hypothetical protein
MADDAPGPAAAETTVGYDDLRSDPAHTTDDGAEPAPVWGESQRLRELIERGKGGRDPSPAERSLLARAVQRQVRTVGLYREIARLLAAPVDPRRPAALTLYVLLFPGEGRDNTGIKDLNDKVLGYELSNEFIQLRQKEIETIFPLPVPTGTTPPPAWFATVGQDYKTASVVAVGRDGKDFAQALVRLDAALRQHLLGLLTRAEQATKDRKRLDAIRTLRRTLERDKRYRFDYLFGVNSLPVGGGRDAVDVLVRLLTEALKGAGLARFVGKARGMRTDTGRRFGRDRGSETVGKGHDSRGREFAIVPFLRALRTARDIKETVSAGYTKRSPIDLQNIFVDRVWTVAFLEYRRLFWGNPDVIRDVRKKALVPPKFREGVKFSFAEQKETLELWLVTLNMLDFVKDFTAAEQTGRLRGFHATALVMLERLFQAGAPIDWDQLERVLTRDVQQTPDPLAVLGTTSEYVFYALTSDHSDRVLFSMDIRDLGVEVVSSYELAAKVIDEGALGEERLVRETLQSTDPTVLRRRFTYAAVAAVFEKYHRFLSQQPTRHAYASQAFGVALDPTALPAYRDSFQVMLGGDEVFVSAHPYYCMVEHLIVAELAATEFVAEQPLNMRTGVVYSSARRVRGGGQRRENQIAHDRALKLAADAPGLLKPLERAHRRIERLIEKLEANDAKAVKGQFHRKTLENLGLLRLYARGKRGFARPLPDDVFDRTRRLLREENVAEALKTGLFELVDFEGAVVHYGRLTADVARLEALVERDVGPDNRHYDVPPPSMLTGMPKWLQKLIDKWADPDRGNKKKASQQSAPPPSPPVVTTALRGQVRA